MNLKEMRLKRNMTQLQLADKMGIAQPRIVEWETGKILPSAESMQRLCESLRCKIVINKHKISYE